MPTFKNIRIPMRNGKTRLQRVQVLKSGKFKFVKNLAKAGKKAVKRVSRRSNPKTPRRVNKTGKLFRNLSGMAVVEDLAVGAVGGKIISESQGLSSGMGLAVTRIGQGIVGHVASRRGKRHLVQGAVDLVDLAIIEGVSIPFLDNLLQRFNLFQ